MKGWRLGRFFRPSTYEDGTADMTLHPAEGDVVFPVPDGEGLSRLWLRGAADAARDAVGAEPPVRYVTLCYGRRFGEYGSYRLAKAVLARHIWNCPEGAMPWARSIRWHRADGRDPLTGVRYATPGWVTSSHGGWLNHGIDETEGDTE